MKRKTNFKITTLFVQRLIGIFFILISIFIVKIAATGTTIEERDCTPVIFTAPLGIFLLITKDSVL